MYQPPSQFDYWSFHCSICWKALFYVASFPPSIQSSHFVINRLLFVRPPFRVYALLSAAAPQHVTLGDIKRTYPKKCE